ncbi:PKD domain-containing protein [Taibaiella koreensis]|uniref:PKD domain-containing protein n=1 Tax=Taibaiella koreensis TaxID=1268548 RepID=UPI000E59E7F5|nr:PKD domain-containing protein [Taibaiella koreensis]
MFLRIFTRYTLFCLLFVLFCSAWSVSEAQPPCQTIIARVNSTSPPSDPADSIVKVCKGTTVTFTGSATFSTSATGATYEWRFNDGTIMPGTTISRNFPDEGVYVVDFVATDASGCVNKNCDSRKIIQVSTTPHFNQIQKPDTMCLHHTATILGIVTPVEGKYDCAPPVSGTTFLPDGQGTPYTTSINVSCFTPCDTVAAPGDIESICLNMEHSYMGDLDIDITCPNGQTLSLLNSNGGGIILGQPVATDLPVDASNLLDPGIGFNYCFSPMSTSGFIHDIANTTNVSPYTDPLGNVSTDNPINQANPGTYQADGNWNNLVGCPMNGSWTITVNDNLPADNGYIFNWGITFSKGIGAYNFIPVYPQQHWDANADIIGTSAGGKNITIKPETGEGLHCYTFRVVDSFNCPYDTTVCVYVIDPGNPGRDTTLKICLGQDPVNAFSYLGNNVTPGGTWSGPGVSPAGMFDPAAAGLGLRPVVYRLHKWNCDTIATITFNVINDVQMDFNFQLLPGCTEDTVRFTNLSEPGRYWWRFGDGSLPEDTTVHPVHIYQDQSNYQVRLTVKDLDGCIDSVLKIVDIRHPLKASFDLSIDSVCQANGTPVVFNDGSIGAANWSWDFNDGTTATVQNPTHTFSLAGTRRVRLIINDKIPCYDTLYRNVYVDSLPFLDLVTDKHSICTGDRVSFTPAFLYTVKSLSWDFGDGTHWQENGATGHSFDQAGTYHITLRADYPVCEDLMKTDSVVVNVMPLVYLGPDSVLCLDGPAVRVGDANNANDPTVRWLWSTGAKTPYIDIVHPGEYAVTATRGDCGTTEKVVVSKDCYTDIPNAFTPNGDGSNDYFYPRQLISKGVVSFSMTVFNRWGQKVFETTNVNGRGWDGRFNDKEQPMGVYIYQIRAVLKNGRAEDYSGNVTLVR